MKPEDLYKAMNKTEPELLDQSEAYQEASKNEKKVVSFRRYGAVAACAAMALILVVAVPKVYESNTTETAMESYDTATEYSMEDSAGASEEAVGNSADESYELQDTEDSAEVEVKGEAMVGTELALYIDDTYVEVEWEDNDAVVALKEAAANGEITVTLSPYGGFEAYGSLGMTLPSEDSYQTTQACDIKLYNSDSIVVFYGSNSYSYTSLGKVTNLTSDELEALIGGQNSTLTISLE